MNEYIAVDCFTINGATVIVLDRDYVFDKNVFFVCEDKEYKFKLNSIKRWVIVKGVHDFLGKKIIFKKRNTIIEN